MIVALAGLALPVVAAWLTLRATLPSPVLGSRLLAASVAFCLGVGAASLMTFWLALVAGGLRPWFVPADAVLWIAVAALAWRRAHRTWGATLTGPRVPSGYAGSRASARFLARLVFLALAGIAIATLVAEYNAAPHGQWDAWAIWNQKARFFIRGGDNWLAMLEIPWSQPAHPILVSASVARLWSYAGAELTVVPAILSAAFGAAVVAAVMGALDVSRTRAWLAGAVLLSAWTYVHLMAAQTADLPVGLFMVISLILLVRIPDAWRGAGEARALLVLAGVMAGVAAWTKNEGLVFIGLTLPWLAWWGVRAARIRDLAWWAVGAAPALAAVAWYKTVLAPQAPQYVDGAMTTGTLLQTLASPERHAIVDPLVAQMSIDWGGPNASGALLLALVAAASVSATAAGRAVRVMTLTAALMLVAYYVVWLVSPLDTEWLVRTTFERLVAQVWPTLVFAIFAARVPKS